MENCVKKLLSTKTHIFICCILLLGSCGPSDAPTENADASDTLKGGISMGQAPPSKQKTIDANDPNLYGNEYEEKYPSGIIRIKGYVIAGLREGEWYSFYENGNAWSSNVYKKGRLNGPTTTYYENGKMRYKGFYKEDQRVGKWTFWDEKGALMEEIDYSKSKE